MIKKFLFWILMPIGIISAQAQNPIHMSVGLTGGTTGLGAELSAAVSDHFQIVAGYSFMPEFSYKKDVEYYYYINNGGNSFKRNEKTEVEGTIHIADGKFLVEYLPSKKYSFHLSAGIYVGKSAIITAQNNIPLKGIENGELIISGHKIKVGTDGIARASIEVNNIKPYIGFGFGRSVPRKRVSASFDMGVMFWGTPTVYEDVTGQHLKTTSVDVNFEDDGIIDRVGSIKVMPVVNFKIVVKLF